MKNIVVHITKIYILNRMCPTCREIVEHTPRACPVVLTHDIDSSYIWDLLDKIDSVCYTCVHRPFPCRTEVVFPSCFCEILSEVAQLFSITQCILLYTLHYTGPTIYPNRTVTTC